MAYFEFEKIGKDRHNALSSNEAVEEEYTRGFHQEG